MATWFDLPQEVKQIILRLLSDTEYVHYVPRDRRLRTDGYYRNFQHFHDLLTVSKNFITPEEFAFAVLSTAQLRLYQSNDLRRLSKEASAVSKQCIREIYFRRSLYRVKDNGYLQYRDCFEDLGNVERILSEMSELKQIYISWNEYCAEIGHYENWNDPTPEERSDMYNYMLSQGKRSEVPDTVKQHYERLHKIIASAIRDRSRANSIQYWTRPFKWIRQVVQYAEKKGIEVIFEVDLCISDMYVGSRRCIDDERNPCWSNQKWGQGYFVQSQPAHVPATMSTKDYMLRVEFEDRKYSFYQELAYEMLHPPSVKSEKWWGDLESRFPMRPCERFYIHVGSGNGAYAF